MFTESLPVSVTVIAGLKLTLICQVQGVPFSQIEWLKNTVPIVFEGNSRTRKYSNGSLEIWPVEKVDGGLYQCVAENSAGNNIQSSSHVIVLCELNFRKFVGDKSLVSILLYRSSNYYFTTTIH